MLETAEISDHIPDSVFKERNPRLVVLFSIMLCTRLWCYIWIYIATASGLCTGLLSWVFVVEWRQNRTTHYP